MDDLYVRLQKALDEAERQARAAARKVAEHIYPPARVDGSWQPEGEVSAGVLIEECGHWTAKPYLFGKAVRGGGRPGWEPWGILTGQPPIADHVAGWDPSTVLRLVERDRKLLAWHDQSASVHCSCSLPLYPCRELVAAAEFWLTDTEERG